MVFTGPNRVAYQAVACPDPGPSDVLVRITHSWISNGTEGSYLRGERSDGDTPFRAGDPLPFPVVAGYQKVGVVERVGEEVNDLVIVLTHSPCPPRGRTPPSRERQGGWERPSLPS